MQPTVEARNLTKSYGNQRGISDITLTANAGEVLGLVGINGAGKSTFMRTLLDFIRPTSGELLVFGETLPENSVAIRRRCSYLPGELVLPSRLTGHQTLRRFSFARKDIDPKRVTDLASRLNLDLSRKVGDLSKGNKQKVGLVLAFAPRSDLLVLDEPTSGLDPVLQRTFGELVSEAADEGRTVLLSSHVMSQVEEIAGRVALIKDGKLALVGDLSSILTKSRRRGTIVPAQLADLEAISKTLNAISNISDVVTTASSLTFACDGEMDELIKALSRYSIRSFDVAHADLEDAFFAITDQEESV